ncbi:MAG TPA: Gfo/Idh/MocA family oxidoreductase [Gaiellaceae bacterium]
MAVGWGIVGGSAIANNVIAPALAKLDGGELVGIVSRDQSRAEAFAARHGARLATTRYDELLEDPAVDIVFVSTPNALHAEQVCTAAAAGKHVLCEKPLATSVADAEAAVAACRDAGVKLGVNFQTRHHQVFAEVRKVIQSGALGAIQIVQCEASAGRVPMQNWRTDSGLAGLGTINNLGVHAYDLLRYLLDSEVAEVAVLLDVGRRDELETIALALLRFESGVLAYVNANQAIPGYQPDIQIYGSEGRIIGRGVTRPWIERGELAILVDGEERVTTTSTVDAYDRTLASFQRAVVDDLEPNPSGMDGLRSVWLTHAMTRSAREGRVVEVER